VVPSKELDHRYYLYQTLWVENHPLWEGEELRGFFSEKRDISCSIMGSCTPTVIIRIVGFPRSTQF